MRWLLLAVLMLIGSIPALADEGWEVLPGMRSEKLAVAHWEMIGTSAVTTTGSQPVLITYWRQSQQGLVLRCFDFFDANMLSTGGACHQAVQR